MSWWGNWEKGGLSKMASSALKQAQKKIDKVLDIQEGEGERAVTSTARASLSSSPLPLSSPNSIADDSFFREWLPEGASSSLSNDKETVVTEETKSPPAPKKKTPKKLIMRKKETSSLISDQPQPPIPLASSPLSEPKPKSEPELSDGPVPPGPHALNITTSQVTNVGDWVMDESVLLPLCETSPSPPPDRQPPPEASADLVRADSASPHPLGVSSSSVSLKSVSESERVEEDDGSAITASFTDHASHLSMSSDCTLRADDRGTSPSEQLAASKDSYESMCSGGDARSAPSEGVLLESAEFEVFNEEEDVLELKSGMEKEDKKEEDTIKKQEEELEEVKVDREEEEEEKQREKVEAGKEEMENQNEEDEKATQRHPTPDVEIPLELAVPDQTVEIPTELTSPAQMDSSPVVLDEVETGTSSDIEVISSCCTSNNGGDHGMVSEHQHALHARCHKARLASHTRSVSDCSFLSNIVESVNSDEGMPYEVLLRKLSEVKEVLEVRESKLLQMSRENIDLRETNNILRQQLHQSESARESEMTDLNVLTVEFTNRIGEAEKRLQAAAREKEQLKKRLQKTEAELTNKNEDLRFERALADKELQIEELLREGEKMAQEQLKTNNIVKKLRAKERDVDATLQLQSAKADRLEKENEHLMRVIDNRDENEKQHVDAINQLTRAVQKQEKEMLTYKRQMDEAQEKSRSLQINLDSAYKELAELRKSNAAAASQAAHLSHSAEVAAKEHAKAAVAQREASWTDERRLLQSELDELRFSLSSQERDSARREEQLRTEIDYLHQKLSQAEQRNEELTSGLGNATRPVLRQLESLQASFNTHSQSWEQAEKQLNERLVESQKALAAANEEERAWRDRVTELEGEAAGFGAQVSALRQEKARLTAVLQSERARAEGADDEKHRLSTQLQAARTEWQETREELRKEALLAESSLDLARGQLEVERRRSQQLSEQLAAAERRLALASAERARSVSIDSGESEPSLTRTIRTPVNSGASLYNLLRENHASGGAAVMEHMQANLQQKDGDIAQLHQELKQLDKSREALLQDMLGSNRRVEELTEDVARLEAALSDRDGLEQRYNALLQMFGEKMEENEELRLDLQDVKDMYKAQIDLLTRK